MTDHVFELQNLAKVLTNLEKSVGLTKKIIDEKQNLFVEKISDFFEREIIPPAKEKSYNFSIDVGAPSHYKLETWETFRKHFLKRYIEGYTDGIRSGDLDISFYLLRNESGMNGLFRVGEDPPKAEVTFFPLLPQKYGFPIKIKLESKDGYFSRQIPIDSMGLKLRNFIIDYEKSILPLFLEKGRINDQVLSVFNQ